jgi:ribosomal protein S18 acetylase RimI-like enzyme
MKVRLASLAADPQARRHGAARALCDACAAWAAEHGFRGLSAAVVVGNDAALRAYESAGFAFTHAITWTGDGRTLEESILRRTL